MHKILKPVKKLSLLFFIFLMLSVAAHGKERKKYYSDGSLKSVGDISKTGEKQNKWQFFYNNGIKMSEGDFLNGKRTGEWTYWNKEGSVIATKDFGDGVKISTVKKEASPETEIRSVSENKKSEPLVEDRSGFAATMEGWKALKAKRQQMPEVKVPTETSTEETHSKAVEPLQEPIPVADQKDKTSEPVQTEPVQEVATQPIAEITEPTESEPELAKKQSPAQKKKPVASGGKFWRN